MILNELEIPIKYTYLIMHVWSLRRTTAYYTSKPQNGNLNNFQLDMADLI